MLPAFFNDPFYRILWIIIFLGWISTSITWSFMASRALQQIDPALRRMRPEYSWLLLIPVWGFFWQFMLVNALAESFRDEFVRRNYIPREEKPGMMSGLSANILFCLVVLPPFGIPITIISYIPRIIHIVKIKRYTAELAQLIAVQNTYAAMEQAQNPVIEIPEPDINFEKNNPDRFKPEMTEEEIWERWRKKD